MPVPSLKPARHVEFSCRQSRYAVAPRLPMRALCYGPSGSGKSVLLQQLILDVFRGCFERIYVFSPSVHLDHVWLPVRRYLERELEVDLEREPCLFPEYDPEALAGILETQYKVAHACKQRGCHVYSVLVVLDDFADRPEFLRQERLLHQLFVRGRHAFVSTVVSSQKVVSVAPIVRVNASCIFCYRLRSNQDLRTFLDECSALVGKDALLRMYRLATGEPYGFLFVDLAATRTDEMFFSRFSHRLVPRAFAESTGETFSERPEEKAAT